jgi:cobalt-zinc-cadmium efflux system outer membrane protein
MMRFIFYMLISVYVVQPAYAALDEKELHNMNDMLNIAIKYNPAIRSSIASIEAAKGQALQASLTINPDILFQAEDFAGKDELSRFNSAELTASIQQTVEIGGKRAYRTESALHNQSIVEQQAVISILTVLFDAQVATIRYFTAQKRLNLIEKRLEITNNVHETIERRVQAAAASDIQLKKIDIERKSTILEKTNAHKDLEIAKASLTKVLAKDISNIMISNILLEKPPDIPDLAKIFTYLNKMPQKQILDFQKEQAEANFNLAKANAIPNPTFGIGMRKLNGMDNYAVVASFSIPAPVFNRNQGEIAKANAELIMAKENIIAGVQSLEASIKNIWSQFNALKIEVNTYTNDIIPSSQQAYDKALEGYDMGRFSFLELLDAQRTLYRMQEAQLMSLAQLHESKAYIDFFMSTHMPLLRDIYKS